MNILSKYSNFKTPTMLLLSAIAYGWSMSANAYECPPVNGWNNKIFNISFPAIAIPRDTAVGKIIYSRAVYFPANESFAETNCEPNRSGLVLAPVYFNGWTYGQINKVNGIFNTNVPGIGIRISTTDNQTFYGGSPGNHTYWKLIEYPGPYTWKSGDGFLLELIKTGPTSTGTLSTGAYAGLVDNRNNKIMSINITDGGSISTPACAVSNSSINVAMGNIRRSEFNGVGSTSAAKTFHIFLDCNASTNIKMTLAATSDKSNAPGVIALNSASGDAVADGVGIQMLYNTNPVTLGAPITVGIASSGGFGVEMVARYYQTKSTVTAGEANGSATFTLTYN